MDVLIIGAGAIGSLPAHKLGAAGHQVTAVGRAPYVQAVTQRGLLVEQNGRATRADQLRAVESVEGIELVSLPGYPVPFLVWALCTLPAQLTLPIFRRVILGSRGGKIPSLHIDLSLARDKSEVEFLNGAVVRAGERLNVSTPINRMLCETLMGIVRGYTPWSQYQGQADRLIYQANPTDSSP